MGKLLTILGISEDKQLRLPKKILQAEKIIAGLQTIYSQSPESNKKDILADTIAETTRLLLAEIGNVKLEAPMPKQEPKEEEPTEEEETEEEEQQPEEPQPEPVPQPEQPQPKPKRKSKKKEPQPSAFPENDDYQNWSQEQLNAKRNEILETIAFFEQNGIDTEELQIELDEINLYIN